MYFKQYAVVILLAVFEVVWSSGPGKCPKYGQMKQFNITRFSGNWFEIERSFYIMELAASCITLELKLNDKRSFDVAIKTKGRLPFRRTLIEGIAASMRRNPGQLLLKINSGLPYGMSTILPGAGIYQILTTDYDNYAVLAKCTSFGFFHIDTFWIFGRRREISAELRAKIYEILTDKEIDTERLIIPRNINCSY